MRVPLSWLREYVEPATPLTAQSLHDALVSVGLEEEDVHTFDVTGPVVVGQVESFVDEPQSNGKTIRWCQVRVAETDTQDAPAARGIVCGADNFVEGDKVVVTLPGAVLPGGFEIAARKTYGHVSDGMIASAKELGLGDDHSGILRLGELGLDPALGTDAIDLLGLDDVAVEVNVTPDRGYAMSIRGIAREYHHATGDPFTDPALTLTPSVGEGFSVTLDDSAPIRRQAGCQVFIARSVTGINATAPTPPFMVARLALAGMRSISLPVDITNYVMLEYGQPIHGYDLDRLTGGITVRRATPGETLRTLDDQERTLDPEDLLITDQSGPIGIAGVMGGAATELDDSSTNVLIEAAWFDPVSIARTARRHKLPSEASKRFQRGVDPLVAEAAAQRVVDLLVHYAGGTAGELGARVVMDLVGQMPQVSFSPESVLGVAGIEVTAERSQAILEDIGCHVESTTEPWSVTPPTWRPDLHDFPTLVEEIARIVGFESIPSLLPQAPSGTGLTAAQAAKRRIVSGLAAAGYTEVLSYPFVEAGLNETFSGVTEDAQVVVANALDPQVNRMRASLLPGLVGVVHRNHSRGLVDLAVFEAGSVFLPPDTLGTDTIEPGATQPSAEAISQMNQSLPAQPWWVAGVLTGTRRPRGVGAPAEPVGIADALQAARDCVALAGGVLEVRQGSHPAFHPGRTAELVVSGTVIGRAGELLPSLAESLDLPRVVAACEIDGTALLGAISGHPTLDPLSPYPAATQDLSVVVATEHAAGDIRQAIVEGAGELLESCELVDSYSGEGLGENQVSLTFALRFRAADRTLTQAEATEAKEAGLALAASRFGATLRG